jgi:FkbM family methyltransferase
MHHQDGTIQRGIGMGLRFNPGPTNAEFLLGTIETDLQRALATLLKPGMTVYDAGANVGFVAVLASRLVGPGGAVICFEPLPSNARWIEHNSLLNGFSWMSVRVEALGAADMRTAFNVLPEATRGMLATSGFAKADSVIVEKLEVTVRSIDSLRAEGAIPPPDVIKLDVEGVEVDAIRGAIETIRACAPILLVELHDTGKAVEEILDEIGYHPVVVESTKPLAEAFWNSHVVAVPKDRPDLIALISPLSRPA